MHRHCDGMDPLSPVGGGGRRWRGGSGERGGRRGGEGEVERGEGGGEGGEERKRVVQRRGRSGGEIGREKGREKGREGRGGRNAAPPPLSANVNAGSIVSIVQYTHAHIYTST